MTEYQGRRFGEKQKAITATIDEGLLKLENGVSESFQLSSLSFYLGGSNQSLVFFKYKGAVEALGYVRKSAAFIKQLQKNEVAGEYRRQYRKSQIINSVFAGLFILLITALPATIYLSKDYLVSGIVQMIPVEHEKELGEQVIKYLLPPGKQIQDEKLSKALSDLTKPLTKIVEENYGPVTILISNSSEINAFAAPGGFMVFNLGLLEAAESGREIMGVTAHELAHIQGRHSMHSMVASLGLYSIVSLFFGDLSGLLVISEQLVALFQLGYSRSLEIEADEVGFQLLIEAGINPLGMADFFEKVIDNKEKSNLPDVSEEYTFLSTHPGTTERIAKIESRYKLLPSEVKTKLQNKVRGYAQLKRILKEESWK